MGLFGTTTDSREDEILERISELSEQLAAVQGKLEGKKNLVALVDEAATLKDQIETLKREKDRLTESHAREVRETKHLVGLEKKRQELELEAAKREAILTVREENLDADKARFDEHIQFVEEKQAKHLEDIKELLAKVMDRIPTVNVDVQKGKRGE